MQLAMCKFSRKIPKNLMIKIMGTGQRGQQKKKQKNALLKRYAVRNQLAVVCISAIPSESFRRAMKQLHAQNELHYAFVAES